MAKRNIFRGAGDSRQPFLPKGVEHIDIIARSGLDRYGARGAEGAELHNLALETPPFGLTAAEPRRDFRCGSDAVIRRCPRNVGFAPGSGRRADIDGRQRSAMCGRLRVGKDFLHARRLVGAAMCSACLCGSHDRWP